MDLDETVAFVEARETGKPNLVLLSGGHPPARLTGSRCRASACWRCGQEGHNGKAPPSIRKTVCKAYTSKCKKCSQVGHFTKVCKKTVDKKTKEEHSLPLQQELPSVQLREV